MSLLLCGSACALWVRSYGKSGDAFGYCAFEAEPERRYGGRGLYRIDRSGGSGTAWYVMSSNGRLRLTWQREDFAGGTLVLVPWRGWFWTTFVPRQVPVSLGPPGPRTPAALSVSLPHWSIVLAGGGLPLFQMLAGQRRLRRIASGRYRGCGYDLRATPDHCPECRTVPEQSHRE